MNPYTDLKNPITLNSTLEAARTSQLRRVAEEAIRIQVKICRKKVFASTHNYTVKLF